LATTGYIAIVIEIIIRILAHTIIATGTTIGIPIIQIGIFQLVLRWLDWPHVIKDIIKEALIIGIATILIAIMVITIPAKETLIAPIEQRPTTLAQM
jgi:hypothetical protein